MSIATAHDPIAVEIHRKALDNIVNEMAITLARTSGSPVVYEVQDFATCLTDRSGEQLAMSSTMLFHAGSSLMGTRLVIENLGDVDVRRGDGWILNDPFEGGALHQGDVGIITPTFYGDDHVGWAFSNLHMVDIGGSGVSGFAPAATSVYEEGLRFPATRVIENGVLDPNWERFIGNNVRVSPIVINDIRSMIAASNVAQEKLTAVIDQYGVERFFEYCEINKDLSEKALRSRIELIPDGRYVQHDIVEYDGQGTDEFLDLSITLTVEGSEMTLELDGDDQIAALINTTHGAAHGWIMTAILTTLGYGDLPFNAGLWRPLSIEVGREGSIVNAVPPVPVSAGHGATGAAVFRAFKGALNEALSLSDDPTIRSRVAGIGDASGAMAPLAGVGRGGMPVVMFFMDTNTGIGGGAQSCMDGQDIYGSAIMLGVSLSSVETNEAKNPAIYLWRRLVKNSGGPGLYRGGQSLESAFALYDTDIARGALIMLCAQTPSNGVGGGFPGANGLVSAMHDTNVLERLSSGQLTLETMLDGTTPPYPSNEGRFVGRTGDVVFLRGGGGAGLGDPLLRDPELVAGDVVDLYITPQNARAGYGVVLTEDGRVDSAATTELRAQIRRERIGREPSLAQRPPAQAGISVRRLADGWSCTSCDSHLAALDDGWRSGAVGRTKTVFERFAELEMHSRQRKDDESVRLTEYFCPSCAAALGTDVHQAGAETARGNPAAAMSA
ncbi:hydantoinase B/oxoprolinase family protein [Nocardioides sp. NPDC051685]|uniref:hydantoinase B/oxoprolinase family protein n=1 Tax=Nocardioides sp. NPDC051685 TaxID=3364334 RepID=UPI0037B35B03